ncbi:MAG: S8 family serine peptidase [Acidobacteria bacterium]|nr:S8 family serine peptidase [Acidobacteriota bacterium]
MLLIGLASANVTTVCPGGVTQSTAPGSGTYCDLNISGCDHGTHVAGIAAGANGSFSGVAKDSNVIAIQVFSRKATNCGPNPAPCTTAYFSDLIHGLESVVTMCFSINFAAGRFEFRGGTIRHQVQAFLETGNNLSHRYCIST